MTRIAQSQLRLAAVANLERQKNDYLKYSNEVSSGVKAASPGDTLFAATIVQNNETLQRITSQKTRLASVTSNLSFQETAISQANDVIVRGQEIATQGANDALAPDGRSRLADEVFALRDQLVNLANSKYQGAYVFAGLDDDDAPFDAQTYTTPATGAGSQRYTYDNATTDPSGAAAGMLSRSVNVADNISVTTQIPGKEIFGDAISALEKLGRSLSGYSTTTTAGAPDGGGVAYVFPADFASQTTDIKASLDALEAARSTKVMTARVTIGAKTAYLDNVAQLLQNSNDDAKAVISNLQDADIDESASKLAQTQTALQASYTVSTQMLRLSILDYL